MGTSNRRSTVQDNSKEDGTAHYFANISAYEVVVGNVRLTSDTAMMGQHVRTHELQSSGIGEATYKRLGSDAQHEVTRVYARHSTALEKL